MHECWGDSKQVRREMKQRAEGEYKKEKVEGRRVFPSTSLFHFAILAVNYTRAHGAILAKNSTFVFFDGDNPITENDT